MPATLKALRVLSDATRLRILALLAHDELSVNELQDTTRMGQSRISTHLGLLQETGLVISRREGNMGASFTVRKVSYGVGVERIFPMHSPSIDRVEIITRGRVRRGKLYYLRNLRGKAARIREKRLT